MTDAERIVWAQLRNRRFAGLKFKRQWSIGPYVVDFCCIERRLVVEVDGGQHTSEGDGPRTRALNSLGYRVIRFWNNDVLTNSDGVGTAILAALETPLPNPSPARGEGLKGNMTPHSSSRLAELGEGGGGAPNG